MLKSLEFSVTFPSTGRSLSGKHDFEEGLTAIHGSNESGKSFRLEMIRWLLFGTKALRAAATDYKKLKGALSFQIRGIDYAVSRSGSNATLVDGAGNPLAAGTSPVNAKILEILGYDLDVFDIANNCLQGKVEYFGDMKPTERKTMVDQVIGLNTLDEITEDAGQKALVHRRVVAEMKTKLVVPAEPVQPDGYKPSTVLQNYLDEMSLIATEASEIQGYLSTKEPVAPVIPDKPVCPTELTLEELEEHQKLRQRISEELVSLKLDRNRLKPCDKTADEIDQLELQLHAYEAWKTKQSLMEQGEHTCPECKYHWYEASDKLKHFENVIEVANPNVTEYTIEALRARVGDAASLKEIDEKISKLVVPENKADLAIELRTYQYQLQSYDNLMKKYSSLMDDYIDELKVRQEKKSRLIAIGDVRGLISEAQTNLTKSRFYETAVQVYDSQKERYEADLAEIAKVEEVVENWTNAKLALKDLRTSVKGHLVPSLNKVASHLLSQMTNGDRTSVLINEEFEILIDGQPLNTLSGSGKAVANLAIRIGLGTVLTNKSFSVFMGDELDASMDDDRAGYTAECLGNLKDVIKQIIIVSHKKPEADHHIEL